MPRLSVSAPSGDQRSASSPDNANSESAHWCAVSPDNGARGCKSPLAVESSPRNGDHGSDDQENLHEMRREIEALKTAVAELQHEKEEMEHQLTASDMARRFVTWRYCFRCLDKDNDGFIGFADVIRYETFTPYSLSSLRRAYALWHSEESSSRPQSDCEDERMDEDEVVKFVAWAEEKSMKEAMDFWFKCADVDGDGWISNHDIMELFEDFHDCVPLRLEDLICQLHDMARPSRPDKGLSLPDIRTCRLGAGVLNLLFNHGNGLQSRSTAEWGRGDNPL